MPLLDVQTNTFCNETCRVFDVASGVYGMSNSHFNDHTWPKVSVEWVLTSLVFMLKVCGSGQVKKVSSCMRMIMDSE